MRWSIDLCQSLAVELYFLYRAGLSGSGKVPVGPSKIVHAIYTYLVGWSHANGRDPSKHGRWSVLADRRPIPAFAGRPPGVAPAQSPEDVMDRTHRGHRGDPDRQGQGMSSGAKRPEDRPASVGSRGARFAPGPTPGLSITIVSAGRPGAFHPTRHSSFSLTSSFATFSPTSVVLV